MEDTKFKVLKKLTKKEATNSDQESSIKPNNRKLEHQDKQKEGRKYNNEKGMIINYLDSNNCHWNNHNTVMTRKQNFNDYNKIVEKEI